MCSIQVVLDDPANRYVDELVSAYPDISEIWLFGSRANGTERPISDWDLLVFGSSGILDLLEGDDRFRDEKMDVLIVYDGDNFKAPWGENRKTGSLREWEWEIESRNAAKYMSSKVLYDESGNMQFNRKVEILNAYRVYPKERRT